MTSSKYIPRVIDAEYVKDYILRISFNNGFVKEFDCKNYLSGGIFEKLKDLNYFKKFFVDGWTVSCPNGADCAPETLYED